MALVDIDSWPTECDSCERLSQTISAQLTKREQCQRLSADYSRLTGQIKVGLQQFVTELRELKNKLDAAAKNRTIQFEEIKRRQRLIERLQTEFQNLHSACGQEPSITVDPNRAALFDEPARSSREGAAIIDINDTASLQQQKARILEDQNRGLEVLSQTLSRQRTLATQLGQEVESQNDILDNLANTMERVDARVQTETGNISLVDRQDSTWGYWVTIIVLFVAIILTSIFLF